MDANKSGLVLKPVHRYLMLLAVGVFIHHFVVTLIYAVDELPVHASVREHANRYSVPFFHQGWKLFAPDVPEIHYEVRYAVSAGDEWHPFRDVNELQGVSNHHRMAYTSQKLQMYLASELRRKLYFGDSAEIEGLDDVAQTAAYHRMVYYISKRHERANGVEPDSMLVTFWVHFAPEFQSGEVFESRSYEFPVFRRLP